MRKDRKRDRKEVQLQEVAGGFLLDHHPVFSQDWEISGLAHWKIFLLNMLIEGGVCQIVNIYTAGCFIEEKVAANHVNMIYAASISDRALSSYRSTYGELFCCHTGVAMLGM